MTGILQAYARKHRKAIDFLKFRYSFLDEIKSEADILEGPQDGVYIYGLHIEAAKWDYKNHCICEQEHGILRS